MKHFNEVLAEIRPYLGADNEFIRARAEVGNSGKSSCLIPIKDLEKYCLQYPNAKISNTYSTLVGGQYDSDVTRLTAMVMDIDAREFINENGVAEKILATVENVRDVQERFPHTAVIHSNGMSLLYLVPDGMPYEENVHLAYQIGMEVERITGLHFDYNTLIRKNGTIAKHRNHLYRFPWGYAKHRKCRPDFYPAKKLIKNGLIIDSGGLNHPLPPATTETPKKSRTTGALNQGSQADEHQKCSVALGIRRRIVLSGGDENKAVLEASIETGLSTKAIRKIYDTYPIREEKNTGFVKSRSTFFKDNRDIGIRGLDSSTRKIQINKTWWGNFGHSVQAFWDLKFGIDVAIYYILNCREFKYFIEKFKIEFGDKWESKMREDVNRLHALYYDPTKRKPLGVNCEKKILEALAIGAKNAPEIAKTINYSEGHVKRALNLMAQKKDPKVFKTGKNKGQKWALVTVPQKQQNDAILSEHTGLDYKEEKVCKQDEVALRPVPEVAINAVSRGWLKWRRPPDSPRNTKGAISRENKILTRYGKRKKHEEKNNETKTEILAQPLTNDCTSWWVNRPLEYRLLKQWFFNPMNPSGCSQQPLCAKDRFVQLLIREFKNKGNGELRRIINRRAYREKGRKRALINAGENKLSVRSDFSEVRPKNDYTVYSNP